jgi:hypothetical protein
MRKLVKIYLSEEQHAEWIRNAGDVPLSKWAANAMDDFLSEYGKRSGSRITDIPRGEELATGEASARGIDASGEVASRRLPKAGKPQKSIPVELPQNIDWPVCDHGANAYTCQTWGCKFYEIPNGRR